MFRLLRKYTKQFMFAAILAPLLVTAEVVFDVFIPRLMSRIIDEGINGAGGSNLQLIYQLGKQMVILSVAAMLT